jgi:hypothetical protein
MGLETTRSATERVHDFPYEQQASVKRLVAPATERQQVFSLVIFGVVIQVMPVKTLFHAATLARCRLVVHAVSPAVATAGLDVVTQPRLMYFPVTLLGHAFLCFRNCILDCLRAMRPIKGVSVSFVPTPKTEFGSTGHRSTAFATAGVFTDAPTAP